MMLLKCPKCGQEHEYERTTNFKQIEKCLHCGADFAINDSLLTVMCESLHKKPEFKPVQTSNNIPRISRQKLLEHFKTELDAVMDVMGYKNGNYGAGEDAFHNFRNTAMRIEGNSEPDSMYKMLMTYMDKHLCALAKNKMSDKEFIERHRDIIVYSLIAIGMKKELENKNK